MTHPEEAVEGLVLEVETKEEDDSELQVISNMNRNFEMAHLPRQEGRS